jgi:hypothetical protein
MSTLKLFCQSWSVIYRLPLGLLTTLGLFTSLSFPGFTLEPLSLGEQINQLNKAVCLQDWNTVLNLVNNIISSSELKNEDRSLYANYRRTIQGYLERNTHFEHISGCETVLQSSTATPQPATTSVSNSIPKERSSFDWSAEVSRLNQRLAARVPTPQNDNSAITPSVTSPPVFSSPQIATTQPEFKADQGIFLRPVPQSNIPNQSISGSLVSSLPVQVDNITVQYDVYQQSQTTGANGSTIYQCIGTQTQRLKDPIAAGAQKSIYISQPDRFVQVIGITWYEDKSAAFVQISRVRTSSNVRPCDGRVYVGRQAVDPQAQL